jgi:hypothetical protein
VADTSVLDLDAHLVGLGRCYLDVLVAELLAGTPGDGRLAGDCLHSNNIPAGLAKLDSRGEPELPGWLMRGCFVLLPVLVPHLSCC